jgi:pantothenate kinase type III
MIGVIDIGNTNYHCGIFKSNSLTSEKRTDKTAEVKNFFSGIDQILCISVVPPKKKLIEEVLTSNIVSFPSDLVQLDYESKPGEDRLANGPGAKDKLRLPAIVVDCGSTITVDLYSESTDPNFLVKFEGGAILPGLTPYFSSVTNAGRLLPGIEPGLLDRPGKNTEECIKLGAYGSLVGGIKEILQILDYQNRDLVFTGGDGKIFSEYFKREYDSGLTLKGGLIAYNELFS